MAVADLMFPGCPLPGCDNPVTDPREICGPCQAAFGDMLRPVDEPTQTAEQFAAAITARDEQVAAIHAERREIAVANEPEWKRNQLCWVCDQRRTCRLDSESRNGWICRECEATPA